MKETTEKTRTTDPHPVPLQAGRELDALIAEKVMGESYPAPITDYPWWSSAPVLSPGRQWIASVHPEGSDQARHIWVPRCYSTEIGSAWEVIERMQSQKRMVSLNWLPDAGEWECRIYPPDYGSAGLEEYSDTAPHAICLAALRAIGEVR